MIEGTTLLGLNGLVALDLRIHNSTLHFMETVLEPASDGKAIETKFSKLFSPGPGLTIGYILWMKICKDVAPITSKPRQLPLAVEEEVPSELTRLRELDTIEPITASE